MNYSFISRFKGNGEFELCDLNYPGMLERMRKTVFTFGTGILQSECIITLPLTCFVVILPFQCNFTLLP